MQLLPDARPDPNGKPAGNPFRGAWYQDCNTFCAANDGMGLWIPIFAPNVQESNCLKRELWTYVCAAFLSTLITQ